MSNGLAADICASGDECGSLTVSSKHNTRIFPRYAKAENCAGSSVLALILLYIVVTAAITNRAVIVIFIV